MLWSDTRSYIDFFCIQWADAILTMMTTNETNVADLVVGLQPPRTSITDSSTIRTSHLYHLQMKLRTTMNWTKVRKTKKCLRSCMLKNVIKLSTSIVEKPLLADSRTFLPTPRIKEMGIEENSCTEVSNSASNIHLPMLIWRWRFFYRFSHFISYFITWFQENKFSQVNVGKSGKFHIIPFISDGKT